MGENEDVESMIQQVRQAVVEKTPVEFLEFPWEDIFQKVYERQPNHPSLMSVWEDCLRAKVQAQETLLLLASNSTDEPDAVVALVQDYLGLAALSTDRENYDDASLQLRNALALLSNDGNTQQQPLLLERVTALLYRVNMACCSWDTFDADGIRLAKSLEVLLEARQGGGASGDSSSILQVPAIHPFDALKFPAISLPQATAIASAYAQRSWLEMNNGKKTRMREATTTTPPQRESVRVATGMATTTTTSTSRTKIRVGFVSPDVGNRRHPLPYLLQDMFRFFDATATELFIYDIGNGDISSSSMLTKIRSSVKLYRSAELASFRQIQTLKRVMEEEDGLDILVDLCGYAGTFRISQLLADASSNSTFRHHRMLQMAYMGFPGSCGTSSPMVDYTIVDEVVVPPHLRKYYTESLIFLPPSYFVNSHRFCAAAASISATPSKKDVLTTQKNRRADYGLPSSSFVFCCHNRPDKMDPTIVRTWLLALQQIQNASSSKDGKPPAILWLLSSGPTMEANLRQFVQQEFPSLTECVFFAHVVPREEHLQRLRDCANVFLDTPAYNAHTVGCDALWSGVPMITLLETTPPTTTTSGNTTTTRTDKWASRVGASLLTAAGNQDEWICSSLQEYQTLMVKCATQKEWFQSQRDKWMTSRSSSALFDTQKWTQNLETALHAAVALHKERATSDSPLPDIHLVLDETTREVGRSNENVEES